MRPFSQRIIEESGGTAEGQIRIALETLQNGQRIDFSIMYEEAAYKVRRIIDERRDQREQSQIRKILQEYERTGKRPDLSQFYDRTLEEIRWRMSNIDEERERIRTEKLISDAVAAYFRTGKISELNHLDVPERIKAQDRIIEIKRERR